MRHLDDGPRRRAAITIIDQMVSSLTNFAATLAAARLLGPEGLGVVALGIAIAYGAVAFTRGVIGESLLVFQQDDVIEGALTAAIVVGLVGSSVCVIVAVVGGGRVMDPLLLLGAAFPLLTFQDTTRYVFFRHARPSLALLSDLLWAVGQAIALVLVASERMPTPSGVVMTWVVGIAVSSVFGALLLRPAIRISEAKRWFRVSRRLSAWVAGQSVVAQAGQQVSFVIVGLFVSLRVLGVVRAAQALLAPVVMFFTVFRVIGLSELGRHDGPMSSVLRTAVRMSLAAGGVAIVYAVFLIRERDVIVSKVFGPSFAPYNGIAIPASLAALAFAVAVGPEIGNRAIAAGRNVFISQVAATLVGVPMMVGLAVAGGPVGAVWGIAGQRGVWAVTAWATFLASGYGRGWTSQRAVQPTPTPAIPTASSVDKT